jgi:hypothetical protein
MGASGDLLRDERGTWRCLNGERGKDARDTAALAASRDPDAAQSRVLANFASL